MGGGGRTRGGWRGQGLGGPKEGLIGQGEGREDKGRVERSR